ncbi:MAG: hypothetical protein EZS28_005640 [Streblomastix strix]|uniref:Thioesterase putative domain-containing protein n=1 Tax=Streblomastix strix TaxID=222440 RepID=A0A5J4WUX1_9EUKA|nr:MAG: hypothetical protein EZS28_005640 [Streblomastix strix]
MSGISFDERAKEIVKKELLMNSLAKTMQIARIEIRNEQNYYICRAWNPVTPIQNQIGTVSGGVGYSLMEIAGELLIRTILPDYLVSPKISTVKFRRWVPGPFAFVKCVILKDSEENMNIEKMKHENIESDIQVEVGMYSVNEVGDDIQDTTVLSQFLMEFQFHVTPHFRL